MAGRPAGGIPRVITCVCLVKTATYNEASRKKSGEADVVKEMEKCQLQFRGYTEKLKYKN